MSRIVLTRRLALGLSSGARFSRCSAMVRVRRAVASGVREPAGSARLELVSGVALLREEDAVLEAMLAGWAKQQLGGCGLAPGTVKQRRAVVCRVLEHAGEYPWNWTAAHLDDWSADLVSG